MKLKTIPLLLVISIFGICAIAEAKEINLQSANVRVSKDKDGDIYVNTGSTRLRVPAHRSYSNVNSRRSYRPINGCNSRNLTRQEVTQVRRSGSTVMHTHLSSYQCN